MDTEEDNYPSSFCCAGATMGSNGISNTTRSSLRSLLRVPTSSACFDAGTLASGTAFDLILVRSSTTGQTACSEPTFCFKPFGGTASSLASNFKVLLEVEILNETIHPLARYRNRRRVVEFPLDRNMRIRLPSDHGTTANATMSERGNEDDEGTDDSALNTLADILKCSCSRGRYTLLNNFGIIIAAACMNIHLWSEQDRIAVVDIDGTITKSNVRGVYDTILTRTYLHCHDGVCELLSTLPDSVRVVYLTARPMSLSDKTRAFLSSVRQANHGLPMGALIGFTGSLMRMMLMELLYKSANEFKLEALQRYVVGPFQALGATVRFSAAFGNTTMDMEAYHAAGMDLHSIYLIDSQSRIFCLDGKDHNTKVVVDRNEFYLLARGSSFHGYRDRRLLSHISERINIVNL
ncbi:hypothetical protein MPSEU_000207500 [Mayamaea pseudoterrestris]|nr:hypothetical protein MPSEU_000207500 [Mayamaea pseudoterrestris]